MKNVKESYNAGPYGGDTHSLRPEMPEADVYVLRVSHLDKLSRKNGEPYRMGDISVKEGDSADDRNVRDEEEKEGAKEEFASKIKQIIAGSFRGSVDGKIVGDKYLIPTVITLIKLEKKYLKNMMDGMSADDPQMVKIKATIEKEAKALKDNSGGLEWPFIK